jgi:hypothetical protein
VNPHTNKNFKNRLRQKGNILSDKKRPIQRKHRQGTRFNAEENNRSKAFQINHKTPPSTNRSLKRKRTLGRIDPDRHGKKEGYDFDIKEHIAKLFEVSYNFNPVFYPDGGHVVEVLIS